MATEVLKVVVRLLPPEITEDELLGTFPETHVSHVKWKSFEAGKKYKGESKATRNARCYLQFDAAEYAEQFIKDYHGHHFVDGHGEQFRAVACYAPYQKVPRAKPQKDPRDGTIFDDPLYQEFVESLGEKKTFEPPPHPVESLRPADPGQTPLLIHIKKMKEKREREKKKERQSKRWDSGLQAVDEEAPTRRRGRWRCSECGTSRHLEEDPDDRGTFYCVSCWESWETHPEPSKSKKKKKKYDKYEEEEEYWAEETTSAKSKKKSGQARKVDEDNWRSQDHRYYGESWEEEKPSWDEDPKSKKKKKKDKQDDYSSYWRVKPSEEYWEETPKAKLKKGSRKEEWWEESEKATSSQGKKKADREAAASGSRWRPKGTAADAGDGYEEETTSRSRRKGKKAEDEDPPSTASASGAYWAPKKRGGY